MENHLASLFSDEVKLCSIMKFQRGSLRVKNGLTRWPHTTRLKEWAQRMSKLLRREGWDLEHFIIPIIIMIKYFIMLFFVYHDDKAHLDPIPGFKREQVTKIDFFYNWYVDNVMILQISRISTKLSYSCMRILMFAFSFIFKSSLPRYAYETSLNMWNFKIILWIKRYYFNIIFCEFFISMIWAKSISIHNLSLSFLNKENIQSCHLIQIRKYWSKNVWLISNVTGKFFLLLNIGTY